MSVLLARGRAADVFADGPGRVRRRYRPGQDWPETNTVRSTAQEAEVMRHARTNGFPVPEVFDAADREILMERIYGRSMLEDLARRPWLVRAHASRLAELHRQLHQISAPSSLGTKFGPERALLHLDLHPDNVILTADGPYVIDWTNAAAGPGAADVAQTWILMASSSIPGSAWLRTIGRIGRKLLVDSFLYHFDSSEVRTYFPAVARARMHDEHLQESERRVIEGMLNGGTK
jgi:aminoglycoside phosphotransferase (APT) family kinase protein